MLINIPILWFCSTLINFYCRSMSVWIHMSLLLLQLSSCTQSTKKSFERNAVTKMTRNMLGPAKAMVNDDLSDDGKQQTIGNSVTRSDIDVDIDDLYIDMKSELPVLLARFCPGSDVCNDTISRNDSFPIKTADYSSCCRCESYFKVCKYTAPILKNRYIKFLKHCPLIYNSEPN